MSIAGIVKKSLIAITKIKIYAIGSNSGTLRISFIITSAIPRIHAIPIRPPIKTITGLLETANDAKTESMEKIISINSICKTTVQKSFRPVKCVLPSRVFRIARLPKNLL